MTQPTDILIIRHGQTAWNTQKRLQGHSDIPLNENGRLQAVTLAEILRDEPLDAIFSSDLQRAYQTAYEIAKIHNLPVHQDRSFRERCYGICEGMKDGEIREAYPESYKAWYAADPDHFFPDGERKTESPRQFHHRAVNAIREAATRYPGKKIAIVTHFGVIETAYRTAQNIPLGTHCRMPVLNTSINRFRWTGGTLELLQWGEASHLEEGRKPPVDYYRHY
ncbi:histidine phosphatase family protein [Oxalobacter aliiformigenes]|uniref:Histidine phosphatase family protein n=1 Tax=Oxalobacter aliiformigenes TaxID=2946593 RepID=A0ABY7JNN9_9BURK|nr:histidine phosphatase family protein [Oxalobacter aliiformigenes]WAV93869.1 histidine phosphatase family protein [Oxalobacter aliiformigenes]WAV94630.1 histidine phosphatase family protein [Oxalobacter aliiformigenes]WAV97564.1 histidine phosphatase family protein [Oxalobacter aliiformigenes]